MVVPYVTDSKTVVLFSTACARILSNAKSWFSRSMRVLCSKIMHPTYQ